MCNYIFSNSILTAFHFKCVSLKISDSAVAASRFRCDWSGPLLCSEGLLRGRERGGEEVSASDPPAVADDQGENAPYACKIPLCV